MAGGLILVDVDTQIDFMHADGALAVPGAEVIAPTLAALAALAARAGLPHLSTLDTHTPDDPEFAAYGFPAHCLAGTPGWAKIPATAPVRPRLIREAADLEGGDREWLFEKATFDAFSHPLFEPALRRLAPGAAIVCGVATDYCVKAAVLGLRRAGVPVVVVSDAIAAVTPETGEAAIAEMKAAGARFLPYAEVEALVMEARAHVA